MGYKFKWDDYYLGDAFDGLHQIGEKSIDLIFSSLPDLSQTDFGKKEEDEYKVFQRRALAEFARVIKDTGFVVLCQTDRKVNGHILTNHYTYIDEMYKQGLDVKDEKIVVRNKVGLRSLYKFSYQYMTVFTRSGKIINKGDWIDDIIIDVQEDTVPGQPTWSQSFCKLVIGHLTKEGDKVLDPFAAAGPVLYCAKNMNRKYWGAELCEERYNENFRLFEEGLDV